jgi:hypothetical protein
MRRTCFVIGPIGEHGSSDREHADTLFNKIIKPTFDEHLPNYSVVRADHISKPGMLDDQIMNLLVEAKLVIADLTTRNPNAFYEIGVRHVLQKPIINVFRRGERIPADIAAFRAIEVAYDTESEITIARELLNKAIRHTEVRGFAVDNPITRAPAFAKLQNPKPRKIPVRFKNGSRAAPLVDNAPSVVWMVRKTGPWEARWVASKQALDEGFMVKSVKLWSGAKTDLKRDQRDFIAEVSRDLDEEQAEFVEEKNLGRLKPRQQENS